MPESPANQFEDNDFQQQVFQALFGSVFPQMEVGPNPSGHPSINTGNIEPEVTVQPRRLPIEREKIEPPFTGSKLVPAMLGGQRGPKLRPLPTKCHDRGADCPYDPCETQICYAFPYAKCQRDDCGCGFKFYLGLKVVNCGEENENELFDYYENENKEPPSDALLEPMRPLLIPSPVSPSSYKYPLLRRMLKCPIGVKMVACKNDPCENATCPSFPEATCKPNRCGACGTEFTLGKVTVDCYSRH